MRTKFTTIMLTLLFLVLCIPLVSYSKDLSRPEAENLLRPFIDENNEKQIFTIYLSGNSGSYVAKNYNLLEAGGYIKATDLGQGKYRVSINDKLKPFIINNKGNEVEVLLGKSEFDKVTGISKIDANRCAVEYSIKVTSTEIGRSLPHIFVQKASPRTTLFVLFDDGWRIDK